MVCSGIGNLVTVPVCNFHGIPINMEVDDSDDSDYVPSDEEKELSSDEMDCGINVDYRDEMGCF